jgi:hypothetical protein
VPFVEVTREAAVFSAEVLDPPSGGDAPVPGTRRRRRRGRTTARSKAAIATTTAATTQPSDDEEEAGCAVASAAGAAWAAVGCPDVLVASVGSVRVPDALAAAGAVELWLPGVPGVEGDLRSDAGSRTLSMDSAVPAEQSTGAPSTAVQVVPVTWMSSVG